jgi:predicted RNA-binding protein with PIN domain
VPQIIDGNNLLMSLGGGSREVLLSELAELARRKRQTLVVVFDGPPPAGRAKVQTLGALTIVSAAPRTADEEIIRRIQESRDPKGITVVSADRGLCGAVKAAGARTASLGQFKEETTKRLTRPPISEGKDRLPVSAKDWERWFADEKNRLR